MILRTMLRTLRAHNPHTDELPLADEPMQHNVDSWDIPLDGGDIPAELPDSPLVQIGPLDV